MSSFRKTLMEAKEDNQDSIVALYNQYRPLINHLSYHDGIYDEDLFQVLSIAFLTAVSKFKL